MTNKTKTETPEKSQIDRFKEAARKLETDDDEARFKERLKKLTEAPPPESVQERKFKLDSGRAKAPKR